MRSALSFRCGHRPGQKCRRNRSHRRQGPWPSTAMLGTPARCCTASDFVFDWSWFALLAYGAPASRRASLGGSRLFAGSDDVELNPPISGSALLGRIRVERTGEPVASCLQALPTHSIQDQEFPDGVCAILRQFQIVLRASAIVGVTFDADHRNVWMVVDQLGHLLQERVRILFDPRGADGEVDFVFDDDQLLRRDDDHLLLLDWATMVAGRAWLVWAVVHIVGNAIPIAVGDRASMVLGRAGLVRASVHFILDAVSISIVDWTTLSVFRSRLVRTLIHGVRHTVVIAIGLRAPVVLRKAFLQRTPIVPVQNPIAVVVEVGALLGQVRLSRCAPRRGERRRDFAKGNPCHRAEARNPDQVAEPGTRENEGLQPVRHLVPPRGEDFVTGGKRREWDEGADDQLGSESCDAVGDRAVNSEVAAEPIRPDVLDAAEQHAQLGRGPKIAELTARAHPRRQRSVAVAAKRT